MSAASAANAASAASTVSAADAANAASAASAPGGSPLPRLGLGCTSMADSYGAVDGREAAATLLAALDAGVTLFDTGGFYGDGANEEPLGRVLAPHRERALLATRTGLRRAPGGRLLPAGAPDELRRACEASLRRLRTDRIDLYYLARGDDVLPAPGSSRRTHLRDNLAALDLRPGAAELAAVDAAVPPGGARGARYGEHGAALLDE